MAFWDYFTATGRAKMREQRELVALDHLRQVIEGEESSLGQLDKIVTTTENLVKAHRFEDAERFVVQTLAPMMERKAVLDSMGKGDWKKFKGSILKRLRAEEKAVR